MARITVTRENEAPPWSFHVRIEEGKSATEHRVSMDEVTYRKLTSGKIPPEACVESAFLFLLEREPKESILSRFDLTKISTYFPEFEKVFPRYLSS